MQPDRLERVEREILHHSDPVVTAPELADELEDMNRRDVLDDLRLLERSGSVESKPTGANAVAWWHTERVKPAPPRSPADHPDQLGFTDAAERLRDQDADDRDVDAEHLDADRDARPQLESLEPDLEDALAGWSPGRDSQQRRERRAAGVEVLRWLRDQPPVEHYRSDVVDALADQLALEGQSADTWWRKVARPALQHAAEAGLVDDSGRSYRWTGSEN